MAGKKHGHALPVPFSENVEKLTLHEGIQPSGRLIQDQQCRIALERAHDRGLLSVAEGKFVHFSGCVELQAVGECPCFLRAVLSAQIGGKFQDIPDLHAGIEQGFRGEIADLLQNGLLLLPDVFSEDLRAAGSR